MKRITAALILTLASSTAFADYYRYRNTDGQLIVTFSLTQEAIKQGYEVINNQGMVIDSVPPAATESALSPQELDKQRAHDIRLLSTYGSVEEYDQAMARREAGFEAELDVIERRIRDVSLSLRSMEDRAGLEERQKGEPSEATLQAIERFERIATEYRSALEDKRVEIEEERQIANADRARLVELLSND